MSSAEQDAASGLRPTSEGLCPSARDGACHVGRRQRETSRVVASPTYLPDRRERRK
jgi:hypothetical protein